MGNHHQLCGELGQQGVIDSKEKVEKLDGVADQATTGEI